MPDAAQHHRRDHCKNSTIDLPQAELVYRPALLARHEAALITAALLDPDTLPWRCDEIRMFGRPVKQPRLTVWMADPAVRYSYSGLSLTPQPWTPMLTELRQRVEVAAGCDFNSVLINQYRNGHDYMGWHRDNERELGSEPVIASLSLGATRFFDLRHRQYRDNKIPVQRFELRSGDLIIMRGATQQFWQHRVPKQTRVAGPRINLSFRRTDATAP